MLTKRARPIDAIFEAKPGEQADSRAVSGSARHRFRTGHTVCVDPVWTARARRTGRGWST